MITGDYLLSDISLSDDVLLGQEIHRPDVHGQHLQETDLGPFEQGNLFVDNRTLSENINNACFHCVEFCVTVVA